VIVAISASLHSASASRVTAVPRRSWNVTPTTPTFAHALRYDARKPDSVQAVPPSVARIVRGRGLPSSISANLRFASSSAAFNGAPTGMTTRARDYVLSGR